MHQRVRHKQAERRRLAEENTTSPSGAAAAQQTFYEACLCLTFFALQCMPNLCKHFLVGCCRESHARGPSVAGIPLLQDGHELTSHGCAACHPVRQAPVSPPPVSLLPHCHRPQPSPEHRLQLCRPGQLPAQLACGLTFLLRKYAARPLTLAV